MVSASKAVGNHFTASICVPVDFELATAKFGHPSQILSMCIFPYGFSDSQESPADALPFVRMVNLEMETLLPLIKSSAIFVTSSAVSP